MALDLFGFKALESSCFNNSMEEITVVLNRKVEARLRECLLHLGWARQELQGEHTIPTAHVMSPGATLVIQEIEEVEYGLNEMLKKLETHSELDAEWSAIHGKKPATTMEDE